MGLTERQRMELRREAEAEAVPVLRRLAAMDELLEALNSDLDDRVNERSGVERGQDVGHDYPGR